MVARAGILILVTGLVHGVLFHKGHAFAVNAINLVVSGDGPPGFWFIVTRMLMTLFSGAILVRALAPAWVGVAIVAFVLARFFPPFSRRARFGIAGLFAAVAAVTNVLSFMRSPKTESVGYPAALSDATGAFVGAFIVFGLIAAILVWSGTSLATKGRSR